MSKYACTPLVMGAKSADSGPVTLARLPTVIELPVTPGAPLPPLDTDVGEFVHAAAARANAVGTTAIRTQFRRRPTAAPFCRGGDDTQRAVPPGMPAWTCDLR